MARGWQYTKLSLLVSALLRVVRACVCAMHPFLFFMGSLRVSASYLSFLAFAFLFCFFPFPILRSFLPCFHFFVSCSRWSFVDIPLIFSCPIDHTGLATLYYWI